MADEYEIQTELQVKTINNRKITNDIIEKKINDISSQVDIEELGSNISELSNQLSEINLESKENDSFDFDLLSAKIEDILINIQKQNERINNIENNIEIIKNNM